MIGTSAGSWTAAALASGFTCDDIFETWDRHPRTERPARVIDATYDLFGDRADPRVTGMAIRVPAGGRVGLLGDRHLLADVVAASSSAPRLTVPHRIGGHSYVDAGITRCTSADRAPAAEVLVVIAPIAGPAFAPYGHLSEWVIHRELATWRSRHGGLVLFVRPTRAIAALLSQGGPDAALDVGAGRRTYRAAYELGLRSAERFRNRHGSAAERLAGVA